VLGGLLIQGYARANDERFGEVDFPISCSSAAQAQFNRGVAMLHSFFYPETIKAFSALAQQEPTCAMAYWGIAISQRPNPLVGPFPGDVLKAGWEAIEKARAAPQKTDRERDWIEALAAFFENYESVPQKRRTASYEAAMARLHARYPNDAEAAVFYALALNEAADPTDKSYAKPLMAAAILEKLETQHPNHPGIAHYIIHSYDYPELAARGVIAANRCAHLAPSAPHALHMPSHVYSTLGMWDDVIGSDLASDETTIAYTARVNPQAAANPAANPARYHSLDFLANAYLQTARDREAKRIVDIRNAVTEFPAGFAIADIPLTQRSPSVMPSSGAPGRKPRRLQFRKRPLRRPRPSFGLGAQSAPLAAATWRRPMRPSTSFARCETSWSRPTMPIGRDRSRFRKRRRLPGWACTNTARPQQSI